MDLDLPVEALIDAAEAGNDAALGLAGQRRRALGTALANAVNLVDVENVVLGGIYAPLAPFLIPGIDEVLQTRVLSAPWSGLRVCAAEVRDYAALSGAASAVLSDVIDDPSAWLDRQIQQGPTESTRARSSWVRGTAPSGDDDEHSAASSKKRSDVSRPATSTPV